MTKQHYPGTSAVVVGGGFAGGGLRQGVDLAERGVQVTLLDKKQDSHQFQPLLYQLATAQLTRATSSTDPRHSRFAAVGEHQAGRGDCCRRRG